tara:strand:+ start:745 stop:2169 length:1425 start_codon:yes stop_codon:yes gene_type:complete
MAEESSFLGIIERLRSEGDLDRNTGSNSVKSLKESFKKELTREGQLTRNKGTNSFKSLKEAIVGNDLAKAEKDREQTALLASIAAGSDSKEEEKSEEKKSKGFFANLGALLLPVGVVLGKFMPVFSKIGGFFSKSGMLAKVFGKGGSLAKFGKALGGVLRKAFWPITIAFGVFKGIVEGIKGYKEGGIMGAIEGFFIGMFDAIIGDLALLIGSIGEKFFGLLGFAQFGEKFNLAITDIIGGFKGYISGIFDALGALFSGDTEAFKEAISSMFASVKRMIVGEDGEGGIFGALKRLIFDIFVTIPQKIAPVLADVIIPFFMETFPKALKETILPKLLEVGKNIAKVISEVFSEMFQLIVSKIPGLGASLGFVKGLFSSAEKDGKVVTPVDPRFANAIAAASGINKGKVDGNTTGSQLEVGMSNIADAKAQPAPVIVAPGGGGATQNTTMNSSNVTYNGSQHTDESSVLTTPVPAY